MIPSSLLKPRFLEVRLERQKRAEELAVVRMQVRTQIANQISNSLILINAGGLAAAIAWVQALPLESDNALQYSCTDVLLNTLPGAGALLLLGILATVVSYVISYAIVGSERRAVLWALGLFAAVLCAVSAAGWTGYTVLNCKSIALDQRIGREVMLSLAAYQQAQTEEERRELFDDLKRRDYKARAKLELATIEAEHRQIAVT